MMRLLDAMCGMPWLIRDSSLRTILEIVSRENESIEAVETRLGRKLDNTRTVTNRDGVAVVPVVGPIVRYADLFAEVSGATSVETLARDLQAAIDNPSVHSIVLDVDSPGGQATGIHELSEVIHAARGQKPIVAYVGGMAASAGYWIASAADEIVIDETAMLGSIGVVFAFRDPSAKSAKEIEIVSTQSPKKRLDPSTEAGRAEYQKYADELAAVFVSRVARNRGVSEEDVTSQFGQGALRTGRDAVSAKMADRVGSFEGLIAELKTKPPAPMRGYSARVSTQEDSSMSDKSFFEKVKALVIGEPSATAEVPTPEVIDAAAVIAENERLKAELAKRDEDATTAEAAAEASRQEAIAARVETFIGSHGARLGLAMRETMTTAYRAALESGNGAHAEELERIAASAPVIGAAERINAGGESVDAAVDAAAGIDDGVSVHAKLHSKIVASLAARGITDRAPNYHDEYTKEARSLTS